ncbi:hypothetical protein J9303_11120 [Bacillaceae bacterium Marseille-Q3522]|nr:hypothetical protein [Bacillaceae bacterium Marseille-Q3522]
MKHSMVDFMKISQALSYSQKALQEDCSRQHSALQVIESAQKELKKALSFSLSLSYKN